MSLRTNWTNSFNLLEFDFYAQRENPEQEHKSRCYLAQPKQTNNRQRFLNQILSINRNHRSYITPVWTVPNIVNSPFIITTKKFSN